MLFYKYRKVIHFLSNIYMHFLHFEFLSKKQLQKCEKQTLALVNLTMELQLSSAQTLLDFTKAKSEKKIVNRHQLNEWTLSSKEGVCTE